MALALTVRATAENATDSTNPSETTGSFTPSDNSLLVVAATSQAESGTIALAISDSVGLTWTSRASSPASSFNMASRIWTAPVTTGVSMTVTVSTTDGFGAVALAVVDLTGYDTGTPTGVNLAANTGSRSGAYSPALSGTSAADSIVIAAGATDFGTATKGASWTDIYDVQSATGGTQHQINIEYIASAVSAANWAALDSSFATTAVAIEIKAAAAGGSLSVNLVGRGGLAGAGGLAGVGGGLVGMPRRGLILPHPSQIKTPERRIYASR